MTDTNQTQTTEQTANPNQGDPASQATDQTTATAAVTDSQASTDAAQQGATDGDATAPEIPEAYTFTLPEGTVLSNDVVGALSEFAKVGKLTQEQAQAHVEKLASAYDAQVQEQLSDMKKAWAEQARSDKEMGGDKFEQSMATAKQALGKFGSPELVKFLEESGLDAHPAMIKTFWQIGKLISEDGFVASQNSASGEPKSRAERMFPNMKTA